MQTVIYPAMWMALKKEIRNKLVEVFGINKTGVSEIRDQTILSDGYTGEDLKVISLEAMCKYIGSQETFLRAWETTLQKIDLELNPPVLTFQEKLDAIKKQEAESEQEQGSVDSRNATQEKSEQGKGVGENDVSAVGKSKKHL